MEIRDKYTPFERRGVDCSVEECFVQQHCKDECDVNKILGKWKVTGQLTHASSKTPMYLDCSSINYKDALDSVLGVQDLFSSLPAEVRKKFKNDPALFCAFADDPENSQQLLDLGVSKVEGSASVDGQTEAK